MGAGIAQMACLGGFETYLHDPFPEALERGTGLVKAGLRKGAERGRWSGDAAVEAERRLHSAPDLKDLSGCGLVIEAAPENLEIKRDLFARLSDVLSPDAVLATNTSSLPVTALASAAKYPEQVVGMHFFNPVPLIELLEVVAGAQSHPQAIDDARAAGEQMGKSVIIAQDGPGFLANRCARPFSLEALRLLGDGIADHAAIDRIMRMGGGFRMGPFELMDLVGIDVGFEVSKSFFEQSFYEPRWQPSPIQARMVQAGRFGRKAGRGYYEYGADGYRDEDPETLAGGGSGRIAIDGEGRLAEELTVLATDAGYDVTRAGSNGGMPDLLVDALVGRTVDEALAALERTATTTAILCVDGSLAELDSGGGAVGFHVLPPLSEARVVELTRSAYTTDTSAREVESFFRALGKHVEWVGDAPGLVLGRIVCQLVNEACFAITAGIGSASDIDTAMRLGYNYPRGPLEWADLIDLDHVLVMLDALFDERHEERYRASPLLRRMVAEGMLGQSTGEGFFSYE
jgi:3-hydroxybutyryl-CoA dehydrogenase